MSCCCCYSVLYIVLVSATMVQRTCAVRHDVMALVAPQTFRATQLHVYIYIYMSNFNLYISIRKAHFLRFSNLCVHLCMKMFIIHSVFTCTRSPPFVNILSVCRICYMGGFYVGYSKKKRILYLIWKTFCESVN